MAIPLEICCSCAEAIRQSLGYIGHEHEAGGDVASEAGGLLLDLRKLNTFCTLYYLDIVLQALSRFSQLFQSSCDTLQHAMSSAEATISFIKNLDIRQTIEDAVANKPPQVADEDRSSLLNDMSNFKSDNGQQLGGSFKQRPCPRLRLDEEDKGQGGCGLLRGGKTGWLECRITT